MNMPIVGKYFPSQKSHEKVFLLLRRHWFTYFGFMIVALIMSIPIFVLIAVWINNPNSFNDQTGNIIIIAVFAYILFSIGLMLYGFIDYYLDVYIVTNERIVNIEQNGFFKREISELHLHQIQDVSAKVNGFFPTMIHYGNVFIQTAGERENFIFKSIPNPYKVSKLIVDLHEAQLEDSLALARDTVAEATPANTDNEEDVDKLSGTNLEGINPKYFSMARKRTKEFLKGEKLQETELDDKVEEEISDVQSEKVLNGIEDIQQTGDVLLEKIDKEEKISARPLESNKSIGLKSEGELHENEIKDIS